MLTLMGGLSGPEQEMRKSREWIGLSRRTGPILDRRF